jgi:30S ribosomal protein S31
MGKGDKSTKRGKIFAGSYGNSRSHNEGKATTAGTPAAAKPAKPAAGRPATKAAPRKKA